MAAGVNDFCPLGMHFLAVRLAREHNAAVGFLMRLFLYGLATGLALLFVCHFLFGLDHLFVCHHYWRECLKAHVANGIFSGLPGSWLCS